MRENEIDQGVIETLGTIGPPAREALPILEKLAQERGYTKQDFDDPSDFLALAMTRIRGSQNF